MREYLLYCTKLFYIKRRHKIDISASISTSGKYSLQVWQWKGGSSGWKQIVITYGGHSTRIEAYKEGIKQANKIIENEVQTQENR